MAAALLLCAVCVLGIDCTPVHGSVAPPSVLPSAAALPRAQPHASTEEGEDAHAIATAGAPQLWTRSPTGLPHSVRRGLSAGEEEVVNEEVNEEDAPPPAASTVTAVAVATTSPTANTSATLGSEDEEETMEPSALNVTASPITSLTPAAATSVGAAKSSTPATAPLPAGAQGKSESGATGADAGASASAMPAPSTSPASSL
ncbi:hypothetical protein EON67_11020, partial [archaeon]